MNGSKTIYSPAIEVTSPWDLDHIMDKLRVAQVNAPRRKVHYMIALRVVDHLRKTRTRWIPPQHPALTRIGIEFPSQMALRDIAPTLCAALFPMRLGPQDLSQKRAETYIEGSLKEALEVLLHQVYLELSYTMRHNDIGTSKIEQKATRIIREFTAALPDLRALLDTDIEAAYRSDPTTQRCYAGVLAIIHYRLTNKLYQLGAPLVARIISKIAHSETGIDIHPGAQIGASFIIDHGEGVDIGEHVVIGERVRIGQSVMLGAQRFYADENGVLQKGLPRHPIVEDDVVIHAGATVLGGITIGRGSTIGSNVWPTEHIPPGSHVSHENSKHEMTQPGHNE